MNILITNIEMDEYTGTTVYVKELAISLLKKGENVQIYSRYIGKIGVELIESGINVTTKLKEITFSPDIIHAHHNLTAFDVLFFFKKTPVVFWIHDRLTPYDHAPLHKNIVKYLCVDYNCKERYAIDCDFSSSDSEVVYNWVNLDRFKLKETFNNKPSKALVFSNYATNSNYLVFIKEACKEYNLDVDVIGRGTGNSVTNPEAYLTQYDLIFGKAKAAMESLATGAGVIVCDFTGLAGFVTSDQLEHYRKFNFGMKLMKRSITKENLMDEIQKYNIEDIKKVTAIIRSDIDMYKTVDQLHLIYTECIDKYRNGYRGDYKFSFKNYLQIKAKTFYDTRHKYIYYNHNSLFVTLQRIKNKVFS